MQNLIPYFIHEQFLKGVHHGRFQAAVMFLDATDFTQLTETLMHGGQEGAEILSSILNSMLHPAIDVITTYGGHVVAFAGDALMATFRLRDTPEEALSRAVAAAWEIQAQFGQQAAYETKFGAFSLALHIGIDFGEVEWGIVGKSEKTFFFRGSAIHGAVQASKQASAGQVIVTDACRPHCAAFARLQPTPNGPGQQVLQVHTTPPKLPLQTPQIDSEVLSRFLPDAIIEQEQTGKFRNVTSVFLAFEEDLSLDALSRLTQTLIELSRDFGGYLNKIIFGDQNMTALCLFGAPQGLEKNVQRALKFVLALQRQLPHLTWRAGITYGTVFAGILGNDRRCEYTVLGDSVNLAARLMKKARWGEILVEEQARLQAQHEFEFAAPQKISIKGKQQPVTIYQLQQEKASGGHLFVGPFIGQKRHMATASQALQKIIHVEHGGLLYIYGHAGAGKSRFLYELQQRHPQIYFWHTTCDAIQRSSLHPFRRLLARYFGLSDNNSAVQNQASFISRYQQLLEKTKQTMPEMAGELTRVRPFIAGFLGLQDADSIYTQLPPELRYQNTLQAFRVLLTILSSTTPLAIIIEDIHWLDEDSTQALAEVWPHMQSLPIAVLVTARYRDDGSLPTLPLDAETTVIQLDRLSADGIQELASSLLSGPISPALLEHLEKKTNGNPFFVVQTIRYYQEEGIIQPSADPPHTYDLSHTDIPIPNTITDLLIARIDRLSATLRQTVQTAAVLGHEFPVQILSEMLRRLGHNIPIDSQLRTGVQQNIWHPLSELAYIFSHAYFRDAVYNMQLREHLRKLHQLAAESIEALYPQEKQMDALIAFHYEQAENSERAAHYLQRAGDTAREQYALQDAANFYRRTLSYLPRQDPRRLSIYQHLGTVLQWQGELEESLAIYRNMEELAGQLSDIVQQARAWNEISLLQDTLGDQQAARESAKRAEELARIDPEAANTELSRALFNQGWGYFRTGDLTKALQLGQEAISLLKTNDPAAQKEYVRCLNLFAAIYWTRGDYQKAKQYWLQSLKIVEDMNDLLNQATMLGNLGSLAASQGKYEEALQLFDRASAIEKKIGDRTGSVITLLNMGDALSALGRYKEAERYIRQSLALMDNADTFVQPAAYRYLAVALLGQNRLDEALEAGEQSILFAQKTEQPSESAASWRILGQLAARFETPITIADQAYTPAACFRKSADMLISLGAQGELARTKRQWAYYELEQGDAQLGEQLWQEALQLFEQLGMEQEVQNMRAER